MKVDCVGGVPGKHRRGHVESNGKQKTRKEGLTGRSGKMEDDV